MACIVQPLQAGFLPSRDPSFAQGLFSRSVDGKSTHRDPASVGRSVRDPRTRRASCAGFHPTCAGYHPPLRAWSVGPGGPDRPTQVSPGFGRGINSGSPLKADDKAARTWFDLASEVRRKERNKFFASRAGASRSVAREFPQSSRRSVGRSLANHRTVRGY